jgi:predicted house-cleaning noncanonical NTP pyrophosphatase (MazG superfamily)
MSAKLFDKLVRDRIPEIINKKGKTCKFRVADQVEYREKLKEKLLEESLEFIDDPCIEELADIQEVIDALQEEYAWTNLKAKKKFKKITRGAFKQKIILEEVIG